MADIAKLRQLIETYGTAVRAGVITPCKADEAYFRAQLGIPDISLDVEKDWESSEGVRRPITLQRPSNAEELPEGSTDLTSGLMQDTAEEQTDEL